MTKTSRHRDGVGRRWWEISGSLRTRLLRLDGQVAAVVHAEKHLLDAAVVSGEVAGQLGRLVQQMGRGTGNGTVDHPERAPGFEPVKPSFTREAGSIRRQVPPPGVREPGE